MKIWMTLIALAAALMVALPVFSAVPVQVEDNTVEAEPAEDSEGPSCEELCDQAESACATQCEGIEDEEEKTACLTTCEEAQTQCMESCGV